MQPGQQLPDFSVKETVWKSSDWGKAKQILGRTLKAETRTRLFTSSQKE